MMARMEAQSIDEVIAALDAIITDARQSANRLGYFAALYRRVTRAVKDGIAAGRFQDGGRMGRLDVIFANRYLDALSEYRAGRQPTHSWAVAFAGAANPLPIVLQQLLAGINAHINLDLGIAAATTSQGAPIAALQADFNQINAVLAEQVGAVEMEMAEISPLIGLLEKCGLTTETCLINFSLNKARDCAWSRALQLTATPQCRWNALIAQLDLEVAILGQMVLTPTPDIAMQLAPIRAAESGNVRKNIEVLSG
ncbi:MAG TPA: DUF5995 family protein [Bryobacteraceae bacterium]|nr:DUF5995 family protein [Bryobacteraceae bacterium]